MDYLYSQLPEIVYDPADLTGKSPKGTMQLNIDNVKREIILDVLKTPGKLTIKDPNNISYEYDGSKDAEIDISAFFDVKIEYKTATTEDINNGIPTSNSKVGDGYLQVESSGNVAYAPIPTPVTSSDIQKINSTETIYNNVEELPDAPIGSIYPVMQDIGGGHKGIILYEKKESEYVEKSRVSRGNVYVVLDSGLLAIAATNLEFKTLDDALKGVQVSLTEEIEKLKSSKQDSLEFTDTYNAEDNKVVVENTLNQMQETLNQSINDVASNTAYSLSNMEESISNIDAKVDGNKIVDIEFRGRDEKDQISRYVQKLADGTELGFSAYTPKGDTGTLEINNVITGEPGTEASVINVNDDNFTRDSHAILDIIIPRGYNADIKNVNVTTGNPGTNASASVNTQEGYLPGQVDLNLTIPRGDKGDAASIGIGATSTLNPGQSATVGITGTSTTTDANGNPIYNDAILSFGIPAGKPAIIKEVTVNDGDPGSSVEVTSNCIEAEATTETTIDFTIPVGKPAEVQVGNVATGEPGTNIVVTASNPDYQTDKVVTTLDFTIPQGKGIGSVEKGSVATDANKVTHTNIIIKDNTSSSNVLGEFTVEAAQGVQGEKGDAATVTIGNVTVGQDNNTASVINVGDSHNAKFNFVIPKGETGTSITGARSTVGTPENDKTVTNIQFTTNDDEVGSFAIPEVKVYADKGEKGDSGVGIASIIAGETTSDAQGYSVTPLTITKTDSTSNTVNVKAKDGISLSHEWDGTSLIVTSSNGTSEAVDLKGEKGDKANVVVGTTTTGAAGTSASVSSSYDSDSNTTTIRFQIPRGEKGEKGDSISITKFFTSEEELNFDIDLGSSSPVAIGSFVLLEDNEENKLYVKLLDDDVTYKYEYVSTLGDIKTAEGLTSVVKDTDGAITIKLKDKNGDDLGDSVDLYIPSTLNVITESGKNYLSLRTSKNVPIGDPIELPNNIDPEEVAGDLKIDPSSKKLFLLNSANETIGNGVELPENIQGLGSELVDEGQNVSIWLIDANGDRIEGSETKFAAGTGGGSGGGSYQLRFERITPTPFIITKTNDAQLKFKVHITEASTGDTLGGYGTWKIGSRILKNESFTYGVENTFDASEYVSLGTTTKISLAIYSDEEKINLLSTVAWNIQVEDIKISTTFDANKSYPVDTEIPFNYTVTGAVEKTVHFKLNGVEIDTKVTSNSGGSLTFNIPGQPHGTYLFETYVTAIINATNIETDHIYNDIIWQDFNENSPLISCKYRKDYYNNGEGFKIKQYNNLKIPFYISDPDTNNHTITKEISVNIKDKDGSYIRTEVFEPSTELLTSNFYEWSFKPTEVGDYTLKLSCDGTTVEVLIVSEYIGFDISPADGYVFEFNPAGRSNNNQSDREWAEATNPNIKMEVSDNFDWQNGGYSVDEKGDPCFCIKSGTYATFSYKLFEKDLRDLGSAFKIAFKTSKVKRADASFLKCVSTDPDDKVGITMNVHDAVISTSSGELFIPYSEEDIIEFEYNVTPLDKDASQTDGYSTTATSHIIGYEDGVMARPLIYNASHRLKQYSPANIVIGSENCDVYIYKIRSYEKSLGDSDILSNFIIDASNSDEMISRYNRNQIYRNENKILEPEILAEKCPDLRIVLIEAPRFTYDKDDKVPDTTVRMIYKNGDPILDNWTCTGAQHSGQGTSSNKYGYSGRNLDLIMNKGGVFTLGDGSPAPDNKITLTRNSVPTNYLNIKVNIASSENENNAQMAQRYNRFNPYTRPAKKKNSKVKDCMEFYNCVVFIKENGNPYQVKDDNGNVSTVIPERQEFLDNNWHFYAIGNVGDSKKTDDTRVDDKNDPKECIVEIMDYNVVLAEFPRGEGVFEPGNEAYDYLYGKGEPEIIGEDTYDKNGYRYKDGKFKSFGYGSYEFRYEKKNITEEQRQFNIDAWRDFYTFVVTSTDEEFKENLKNYFVVDSALYYYLFTERYTMVDNRAKNSFWHRSKVYISEAEALNLGDDANIYQIDNSAAAINEGYRWDLCFGYDFDTSLGIDNTGRLVLDYGMEDIDKYSDNSYIFRAAESTFFTRLRDKFSNELKVMFSDREGVYAWSSTGVNGLIDQWDSNQNQFPEELWRRDIERKYLRTYQGASLDNSIAKAPDAQFLQNMMNGRKKYQRRQFEKNQELYFASKYVSDSFQSNFIQLRAGNPTEYAIPPNYSLLLTPYIDMYVTVGYGNAGNRGGERVSAGEEYLIVYDQSSADLTYIYGASHLQAIGDLSAFYPYAPGFSSGSRLQEIIIGNDAPGYENSFLTSVDFTANTMLEKLNIQNTTALTGSLNLSSCLELKELYAQGSAITGVSFANRGKLEKAYLPETISELSLRNLNSIEELEVTYSNITKLEIESSNIDEKQFTQNVINNGRLRELYLYGINWTESNSLPSTELLNKIYNLYNSELSGNIHISGDIGSYEKENFESKWEDLNLTYNNFIQYYLVRYVGANGEILYSEYVRQGGYPSSSSIDGTIGGNIETPTKASTSQYNYIFKKWDDNVTKQVTSNIDINAEFDSIVRTYTVTWYDKLIDGEVLCVKENIAYGSEVIYDGTLLESYYNSSTVQSHVFLGWDKSTGFVKKDTNVYPIWEIATAPTYSSDYGKFVNSKGEVLELHDMSVGQLHAIISRDKLKQAGDQGISTPPLYEIFDVKDHYDIVLGNDLEFKSPIDGDIDNIIESEVLVDINNPKYFDGSSSNVVDTGISLFGEEDPSFTLAIDYKFSNDTRDCNTLLSCYSNEGGSNSGFRLISYNSGNSQKYVPLIQYSSPNAYNTTQVGNYCLNDEVNQKYYRGMVVITHTKGENTLKIFSDYNSEAVNITSAKNQSPSMTINEATFNLQRLRESSLNIILGATKIATGYNDLGVGTINWCKIWHENLGDANAREIASWYREKIRFEYCGGDPENPDISKGRYIVERFSNEESNETLNGVTLYSSMSFIPNNLLEDRKMLMTTLGSGSAPQVLVSWEYAGKDINNNLMLDQGEISESNLMREFFNNRFYKAFPFAWRQLIRKSQVKYSNSTASNNGNIVEDLYNYIYIPSAYDFNVTSSAYYRLEGNSNFGPVDIFNTETPATCGKFQGIIVNDDKEIFTSTQDPSVNLSNQISDGDIWCKLQSNDSSVEIIYICLSINEINQRCMPYIELGGEHLKSSYGWVQACAYPSRTRIQQNWRTNFAIGENGAKSTLNVSTKYSGLLPCFSI